MSTRTPRTYDELLGEMDDFRPLPGVTGLSAVWRLLDRGEFHAAVEVFTEARREDAGLRYFNAKDRLDIAEADVHDAKQKLARAKERRAKAERRYQRAAARFDALSHER